MKTRDEQIGELDQLAKEAAQIIGPTGQETRHGSPRLSTFRCRAGFPHLYRGYLDVATSVTVDGTKLISKELFQAELKKSLLELSNRLKGWAEKLP